MAIHPLKTFFNKNNASNAFKYAKPYAVSALDLLFSCIIYVLNALNHARIRARMEPFIFLASAATIIYAVFAYRQWYVMRDQLAEMVADQRPWVSEKIISYSGITYDVNGPNITLVMQLENTGHSPAMAVNIRSEPLVYVIPSANAKLEQRRFCRSIYHEPPTFGYNVFPGDKIPAKIIATFGKDQIDTAIKKYSEEFPTKEPRRDFFSLQIVGCVDYTFATGADHHQTPFIYDFGEKTDGGIMLSIDREHGDIPAQRVGITRSMWYVGPAT